MPTNDFSWSDANDVLKYLISPELQERLFVIKWIFIVVCIIFVGFIVFFFIKSEYFNWLFIKNWRNFLFPRIVRKRWITKKWNKVKHDLDRAKFESQWKVTLIEALEVFDSTLEKVGCQGKNLTEKLKRLTKDDITNLNDVLQASQTCQNLVQDPDYKIDKNQAEDIIKIFEKSLIDLELL